MMIQNHIRSKT